MEPAPGGGGGNCGAADPAGVQLAFGIRGFRKVVVGLCPSRLRNERNKSRYQSGLTEQELSEYRLSHFVFRPGYCRTALGCGPATAWAILYCLASPLSPGVLRSSLRFLPLTAQIPTQHALPAKTRSII